MKKKACLFLALVLANSHNLSGYITNLLVLKHPKTKAEVSLWGERHHYVKDDLYKQECNQLETLLSACKSYQEKSPELVLLVEDCIAACGYKDTVFDQLFGILGGLCNGVRLVKNPGLVVENIDTRALIGAAINLFDIYYFPAEAICKPSDVASSRRKDLCTITIGQLFDEIEVGLASLIKELNSSLVTFDRIDAAIDAYEALIELLSRHNVGEETSLAAYAMQLALQDMAEQSKELDQEMNLFLKGYKKSFSDDEYEYRKTRLMCLWKNSEKKPWYKQERHKILKLLCTIGDTFVELGAVTTILGMQNKGNKIALLAGVAHVAWIVKALEESGYALQSSVQCKEKQALDTGNFKILYQSKS